MSEAKGFKATDLKDPKNTLVRDGTKIKKGFERPEESTRVVRDRAQSGSGSK